MLWISKWTGPSYCSSHDFKSLVATSSMSRHRSHVATSLYAFAGFNWSLMMSRHHSLIATSAQVFCRLQMVARDVATSISCRDINLMNCSFQLMPSVVAISIPLVSAQNSAAYLVIPGTTCINFSLIFLMSRLHNWTVQTPKLQH